MSTRDNVTLRYGTETEYMQRVRDKRVGTSGSELVLMRKRAGDWEARTEEFMRWAVKRGLARKIEVGEDGTYKIYRLDYTF